MTENRDAGASVRQFTAELVGAAMAGAYVVVAVALFVLSCVGSFRFPGEIVAELVGRCAAVVQARRPADPGSVFTVAVTDERARPVEVDRLPPGPLAALRALLAALGEDDESRDIQPGAGDPWRARRRRRRRDPPARVARGTVRQLDGGLALAELFRPMSPVADGTIEVSGPADGTVTVRAQGAPQATDLAAALTGATGSAPTVLLDLTGVDHFTTEAVAVLIPHLKRAGSRMIVTASAVVEGKLARLGLAGLVAPSTESRT